MRELVTAGLLKKDHYDVRLYAAKNSIKITDALHIMIKDFLDKEKK